MSGGSQDRSPRDNRVSLPPCRSWWPLPGWSGAIIYLASISSFLFFQRRFQFHEYVKPVGKPLLTDFCTGLTGITQDMIKVLSPGVCPLIINTWDWGDARQISVSYMILFSSNLIGNFITGQGYFSWCTVALRFLVCIEKYLISALDQLEMFWKGTNLMALTPPMPPLWPVGSGIWSQCYLNNASIQARRFFRIKVLYIHSLLHRFDIASNVGCGYFWWVSFHMHMR